MSVKGLLLAIDVPEPSYAGPWMHWFSGFTGWLLATALFVLGIVIVVGLAFWAWGKIDSSQRAQTNGIVTVAVGTVAASIVAVAGSAIAWASDLGPDWMSF